MTDENTTLPEREKVSLRAAEYVLGLLPVEEAKRLRQEMVGDGALSADIALWEESFACIAENLRPVAPPDSVWQHIESTLNAVPPNAREKTAIRVHPSVVQTSLWDNIAFWRSISFAGIGTAVMASIVAFVLFWQSSALPTGQSPLVAVLQARQGQAVFVATFDPQNRQIIVVPAQINHETERVPELWLVTRDRRSISLGVIASESAQAVIIPPDLVDDTHAGAELLITLEPAGGAPGGVATGPTIAQGKLSPI